MLSQGINWAKLELEYLKLTAAEKLIILLSMFIIGAIFLLFLLPVFTMFLFALAGVFKIFMSPSLAYLSVGGIALLLLALVCVFRKHLIINPVAKFVSRLFLDKNNNPHS